MFAVYIQHDAGHIYEKGSSRALERPCVFGPFPASELKHSLLKGHYLLQSPRFVAKPAFLAREGFDYPTVRR